MAMTTHESIEAEVERDGLAAEVVKRMGGTRGREPLEERVWLLVGGVVWASGCGCSTDHHLLIILRSILGR